MVGGDWPELKAREGSWEVWGRWVCKAGHALSTSLTPERGSREEALGP